MEKTKPTKKEEREFFEELACWEARNHLKDCKECQKWYLKLENGAKIED